MMSKFIWLSVAVLFSTCNVEVAWAEEETACPYVQKKFYTKFPKKPSWFNSEIYDSTSPLSLLLKGAAVRELKLKNARSDHNAIVAVQWRKTWTGSRKNDVFDGAVKKGEDFEIPFFRDLDMRKNYKSIFLEYSRQDFDGLEMTIDLRDLSCD